MGFVIHLPDSCIIILADENEADLRLGTSVGPHASVYPDDVEIAIRYVVVNKQRKRPLQQNV